MTIKSFKNRDTEALWYGDDVRRFRGIRRQAQRRLALLANAAALADLLVFPGNRLHPLRGAREGQYAIRINDQWRICFRWNNGPDDVEIVDYH